MLDVVMPDVDGLEAVKELGKKAKVLMVSAVGQDTIIAEAKSSGALGYIVKPFEKGKVISELKKVLAQCSEMWQGYVLLEVLNWVKSFLFLQVFKVLLEVVDMRKGKIKVLVVDDSFFMRKIIIDLLKTDQDIENYI